MPDEENTIYKFGKTELPLQTVIGTSNYNAQSYVEHMKWDADKAHQFYTALGDIVTAADAGRLSTGLDGKITDTAGLLHNDDNYEDRKGRTIDVQGKAELSKRKQGKLQHGFNPHQEAAYYFNIICQSVADDEYNKRKAAEEEAKRKEEEANKPVAFDLSQHGLFPSFVKHISPSGSMDWSWWWDLDPYSKETGSRGVESRSAKLSSYIKDYMEQLKNNTTYDFSNTGLSKDEYIKRLGDLASALGDKKLDEEDMGLLLALGAEPNEYRKWFMTTEKWGEGESEQTEEEEEAVEDAKMLQELRAKYNNKNYNTYKSEHPKTVPITATDQNERSKIWWDWLRQNDTDTDANGSYRLSETFMHSDKLKKSDGSGLEDYIGQYIEEIGVEQGASDDTVHTIPFGTLYAGWKYLPASLNTDDGSVLAYNPMTGEVKRLFYADLGQDERDWLLGQLRKGKKFKKTQEEDNRLAGVEKKQAGGNIPDPYAAEKAAKQYAQTMQKRAQETREDPKARLAGEGKSSYNDMGITSTDIARLGSIALDIGAIIDPEGWSSLGMGVLSDITNLGADLKEGYGLWKSLGNFGANLALSAVGLVPIVGGALGKGSSVVKALVKLAPKLSTALTAGGIAMAVSNGPAILKSLGKIGSSKPEDKMTFEDWRNILSAIQLVIGGTNAIKRASIAKANTNAAKTGKVLVSVVDKNGQKGVMGFTGEDAIKLRKAAEGEDISTINTLLKEFNGGDYKLDTTTKTRNKNIFNRILNRTGSVETFNANSVREQTDFSRLREAFADRSSLTGRGYMSRHIERYPVTRGAMETETIQTGRLIPENRRLPQTAQARVANQPKPRRNIQEVNPYAVGRREPMTEIESSMYARGYRPAVEGSKAPAIFVGGQWWTFPTSAVFASGGSINRAKNVVVKAFAGDTTNSFTTGSVGSRTSRTKNYGTDFLPEDIIDAALREYGQENKVAGLDIEGAPSDLRGDNLKADREKTDYEDLQNATDIWRNKYWDKANGNTRRVSDFVAWARDWWSQPDNQGKTQADMLTAYNKAIAGMYGYKRKMGSSKDQYINNPEVGEFNRAHQSIYRGINEEGFLGYDKNWENVNGTNTAVRPIDITAEDIDNLDFSTAFTDEDSEDFRNLFKGLVKGANGQYYVWNEKEPEVLKSGEDAEGGADGAVVGGKDKNSKEKQNSELDSEHNYKNGEVKPKSPWNMRGFWDTLPEALSMSRYIGSLSTNNAIYHNTKKFPINLYRPTWQYRWIEGYQPAIQAGHNAAGQFMHVASTPLTPDAAAQTAAMFEAVKNGNNAIAQGYRTNDEKTQASTEANYKQETENRLSRYQNSMKNLENLALHRTNVLTAGNQRRNANYQSFYNLFGGLEYDAREWREKNSQLADAYAEESQKNTYLNDLDAANISKDPKDQELINKILTGVVQYEDLDATQQARYAEIMRKVEELMYQWRASRIGVRYTPYNGGSNSSTLPWTVQPWYPGMSSVNVGSSSGFNPTVRNQKKGGKIGEDTEKVAIQKLRGKIQKMQTFQKHLDARMTACEKALDRAQRSSSQYWRGMTR